MLPLSQTIEQRTIIMKKIDLHEKAHLKGIHLQVKTQHRNIFQSQSKLRHPSFKTHRYPLAFIKSNPTLLHEMRQEQHIIQNLKDKNIEPCNPEHPQNRTYNNNYKSFPKRTSLSSPYTIKNSIKIPIFSSRIHKEEEINHNLARHLSVQLKKLRYFYTAQDCLQQSKTLPGQNSRLKSQKTSKRIKTTKAPQTNRQSTNSREKVSKFTPWEVEQFDSQL